MLKANILAAAFWSATLAAQPAGMPGIAIAERGAFPESLAASRDGTIFAGNVRKAVIYRALPGATVARPWVTLPAAEASRVMGLFVDDRRKLLWACTYAPAPQGGGKGAASIRTFDLASGKAQRRYAFDGGCNDMTVAADGTVYATDFANGRVLRLRPKETAFTVIADGEELASADGIAPLADGSLLVNTFRGGKLFRIATRSGDGPAVRPITTSRPLIRPDGMRAIGGDRFALAEGGGRIAEVLVSGDHAEIRTVAENLPKNPTSVAVVGKRAIVSIADFATLGQPDADAVEASLLQIPFPGISDEQARP